MLQMTGHLSNALAIAEGLQLNIPSNVRGTQLLVGHSCPECGVGCFFL